MNNWWWNEECQIRGREFIINVKDGYAARTVFTVVGNLPATALVYDYARAMGEELTETDMRDMLDTEMGPIGAAWRVAHGQPRVVAHG